jgi:hypothetical protein
VDGLLSSADDLTNHAIGHKEMCLLPRRPPAREACLGDVVVISGSNSCGSVHCVLDPGRSVVDL